MTPGRAGRSPGSRRSAQRRGRWAEHVAAWYLRLSGWRVVARNLRCPVGEIDIVATRAGLVAFVEVKRRADRAAAAAAIAPRQQLRIARASQWFLKRRVDLAARSIRYDALLIGRWGWPRHVKNVFMADGFASGGRPRLP